MLPARAGPRLGEGIINIGALVGERTGVVRGDGGAWVGAAGEPAGIAVISLTITRWPHPTCSGMPSRLLTPLEERRPALADDSSRFDGPQMGGSASLKRWTGKIEASRRGEQGHGIKGIRLDIIVVASIRHRRYDR
jgi:hypothetical protein